MDKHAETFNPRWVFTRESLTPIVGSKDWKKEINKLVKITDFEHIYVLDDRAELVDPLDHTFDIPPWTKDEEDPYLLLFGDVFAFIVTRATGNSPKEIKIEVEMKFPFLKILKFLREERCERIAEKREWERGKRELKSWLSNWERSLPF
eukprot:TRINITY_DN6524_c0_g1_i4.p2 TRINITY_DN6524_c0_g1~~TRINITY_DN6524_c0_g1_i4.p2  ORF type:complete len:149 (-),score=49.70 TRINITY_DN6524_c0_g1_i4:805-1251(-)